MAGKGLGAIHDPDPRDAEYPIRIPPDEELPTASAVALDRGWRYWWAGGLWADQGRTGTCVGHAWAHWSEDGPVTQEGVIDPFWIYRQCVLRDPWSENDHEFTASNDRLQFGTSTRVGAKVLQEHGRIGVYRWAWDVETIVATLLAVSPVVFSSDWFSTMDDPDSRGRVTVGGSRRGRHAYVLNGVNVQRNKVRGKNSWGRRWGRGGYFEIPLDPDFHRLVEQGRAEAVIAEERRAA